MAGGENTDLHATIFFWTNIRQIKNLNLSRTKDKKYTMYDAVVVNGSPRSVTEKHFKILSQNCMLHTVGHKIKKVQAKKTREIK